MVLDDIWNKPDLYSFVLIIWLVSVVLNFHSNSEFEAKWPDWEAINWLILLINIPDRVLFVKFYNCQEIYISCLMFSEITESAWNIQRCGWLKWMWNHYAPGMVVDSPAPMNSRCLVYCVKIEWDAVYLFKDW